MIAASMFLSGCTGLFFQPTKKLYSDPSENGYPCLGIKFNSKDGTMLTGIFFPATTAAKGTIIHFHGNSQNMTAHYPFISWASKFGYNVFTFDYRGYGASKGVAHSMTDAVQDSIAALETVLDMPGIDVDKIILFGQSLGSAMAIAAAAETGFEPAAIVLEGSFYSYKSIAKSVLMKRWITWPLLPLPYIAITGKYAPKNEIQKIKAPKIFIHSIKDSIVPYEQGKKLYEHAPGPKEFWDVPGGHIDAFIMYSNKYSPMLLKYLDKVLKNEPEEYDSEVKVIGLTPN